MHFSIVWLIMKQSYVFCLEWHFIYFHVGPAAAGCRELARVSALTEVNTNLHLYLYFRCNRKMLKNCEANYRTYIWESLYGHQRSCEVFRSHNITFIGVNSLDHFKMATAPLLHRLDNHSKLLSLSSKTGRCLKLCSQLPHKYMGVPFGPPKILYSLQVAQYTNNQRYQFLINISILQKQKQCFMSSALLISLAYVDKYFSIHQRQ